MIGLENIANKIYSYMKATGFQFTMYDEEGQETVEPSDSRYFYCLDPNMMLSLDEENDTVKFHKGKDVELDEIEKFHSRVRNLIQRYPLSFEFRVFGKSIKPNDYAHRGEINKGSETTMSTKTISEKLHEQAQRGIKINKALYESAQKLNDLSLTGQIEALAASLKESDSLVFDFFMEMRNKLSNKRSLTEQEKELTVKLIRSAKMDEQLDESIDVIKKEYKDLMKMPKSELIRLWKQQHRVVADKPDFYNKDHVVSTILHDKHGSRRMRQAFKVDEGYTVLPPIDRERYTDIPGLEGPIMMRNGQVLYYDPKEGRYYDRDRDMYITDEEYFAMDRQRHQNEEQMFESKLNEYSFENLFEATVDESFGAVVNKKLSRKSQAPSVNTKYVTNLSDNDLEDLIATSTGAMKAAGEREQQRRKLQK